MREDFRMDTDVEICFNFGCHVQYRSSFMLKTLKTLKLTTVTNYLAGSFFITKNWIWRVVSICSYALIPSCSQNLVFLVLFFQQFFDLGNFWLRVCLFGTKLVILWVSSRWDRKAFWFSWFPVSEHFSPVCDTSMSFKSNKVDWKIFRQ